MGKSFKVTHARLVLSRSKRDLWIQHFGEGLFLKFEPYPDSLIVRGSLYGKRFKFRLNPEQIQVLRCFVGEYFPLDGTTFPQWCRIVGRGELLDVLETQGYPSGTRKERAAQKSKSLLAWAST